MSSDSDIGTLQARRFAQMLGADFAIVTKVRPAHELALAAEVIGNVAGKVVLLGDDMIVTGTLVAAACALQQSGATDVRAFATHALFAPNSLEELARSDLSEIVVTDTVAFDEAALPANVKVLTVADLLADTIRNVFADRSVSALFAGENELF